MRLLIRPLFFCFAESKRKEKLNPRPPLVPSLQNKNENKISPHLASLALAALASALAAAVAVASAQPTSIGGLIQQIPVVGTQIKPCPPVGFDSLPNFNLTAYVSAPWYIQQQVRRIGAERESCRERERERESAETRARLERDRKKKRERKRRGVRRQRLFAPKKPLISTSTSKLSSLPSFPPPPPALPLALSPDRNRSRSSTSP